MRHIFLGQKSSLRAGLVPAQSSCPWPARQVCPGWTAQAVGTKKPNCGLKNLCTCVWQGSKLAYLTPRIARRDSQEAPPTLGWIQQPILNYSQCMPRLPGTCHLSQGMSMVTCFNPSSASRQLGKFLNLSKSQFAPMWNRDNNSYCIESRWGLKMWSCVWSTQNVPLVVDIDTYNLDPTCLSIRKWSSPFH